VRLRISRPGALHFVGPDPAVCDGTICQLPDGETERQDQCTRRLDVDVEAEIETLDGAVRAGLKGTVSMMHPEYSGPGASEVWRDPYFNLRTDLSAVTGTLRLAPKPGGVRYVGLLLATGFMHSDQTSGEISPVVRIFNPDGVTVHDYWPLHGSF
jgi:hypothetical protein